MDALRNLVDAGLAAQNAFEIAEATLEIAKAARTAAADRVKHELSNLEHALSGACVIHGDRVLSVVFDTTKSMKQIKAVPLVQFKIVVPPSPPEAESSLAEQLATVTAASSPAKSQPEPIKPTPVPTPMSAGTIPPLGKKGPGQK